MVSDATVQHRITDVSRHTIEPDNIYAQTGATDENDAESSPQPNPVVLLGKRDAVNAQSTGQHACLSSPTPDNDQSVFPNSELIRPSTVQQRCRPEVAEEVVVADEAHTPNIIIFGEAGVGKSSVINLIAGQRRAHISNDAFGCTFQYQRHIIALDGMPFAFWDTTGLDEGSEGTVPAKMAESNLRRLIRSLAHSGGIHLIIYCIRGTRLTEALKHNYDLFYVSVCRKKVPIALVVTGLEHQQETMETWWDESKAALQRHGLWFDAHACVTTLEIDDPVVRTRRSDSQRRLRDLVVTYARNTPCNIEPSLISWATFRNILSGSSFMGRNTTRRVIIYDDTASCGTRTCLIGGRQLEYQLVNISNPLLPSTSGKMVGLLVFYSSTLVDAQISPNDIATLKVFYEIVGRTTHPNTIVVLRGCSDDRVVDRCWKAVALQCSGIRAFPTVDEQTRLNEMIEKLCVEHVEVKTSRLQRMYDAVMGSWSSLRRWFIKRNTSAMYSP